MTSSHSLRYLALARGMLRALLKGERVRFQGQSQYNRLFVLDRGRRRFLVFAEEGQSRWELRPELTYQTCISMGADVRPGRGVADFFQLYRVFKPEPSQALLLGLGGGAVARKLLARHPRLKLTTVELDPLVVQVARKWFKLPRPRRHQVVVADGRRFLEEHQQRYDLLMVDAFSHRGMPGKLVTQEFFALARQRLTCQGVLAININGALRGEKSMLFARVLAGIRNSFSQAYIFPAQPTRPQAIQSILVYAGNHILTQEQIQLKAGEMEELTKGLWQREISGFAPLLDQGLPKTGVLDIYAFGGENHGSAL